MRLVQRRGQRPAEPDLQDPAVGLRPDEPITVEPMRAFPLDPRPRHRRVVELRGQQVDPAVHAADRHAPVEDWRWQQEDIERVQEFRKCIECFLCQDVCHVLRNHETERPFMGPRFLVRTAGLEMHPIDQADRRGYLKDEGGIGFCNITKCCTEVCPEHIKITDNAIIPLKERVADEYYDPIQVVWRKLRGARLEAGGAGRRDRCRRARRRPPDDGARPGGPATSAGATPDAASSSGPTAPPAATPGPASAGAVLIDVGRPDARDPRAAPDATISEFLGVQTNNVAEYTAVVRALGAGRRARRAGGRDAPRLEADRRAARRPLAGQGREARSRSAEASRRLLRGLRPLVGRPRPAGPELASPTRSATRRSTGSRRVGRRSSSGGRTGSPEPERRRRRQAADMRVRRLLSRFLVLAALRPPAATRRRPAGPRARRARRRRPFAGPLDGDRGRRPAAGARSRAVDPVRRGAASGDRRMQRVQRRRTATTRRPGAIAFDSLAMTAMGWLRRGVSDAVETAFGAIRSRAPTGSPSTPTAGCTSRSGRRDRAREGARGLSMTDAPSPRSPPTDADEPAERSLVWTLLARSSQIVEPG